MLDEAMVAMVAAVALVATVAAVAMEVELVAVAVEVELVAALTAATQSDNPALTQIAAEEKERELRRRRLMRRKRLLLAPTSSKLWQRRGRPCTSKHRTWPMSTWLGRVWRTKGWGATALVFLKDAVKVQRDYLSETFAVWRL